MLTVALTGGIGAGKSTAAWLLAERGATVIEADEVARAVVEPGTPALAAIIERFGSEVLDADGTLDRAALAAVVFADERARLDLEAIVHPAVDAENRRRRAELPAKTVLVYAVPLLAANFERIRRHDVVVLVEAPRERRLARLEDRGMTRADAEARIATQPSDEEGHTLADVVLDNSQGFEHLERQIDRLWPELAARV